jgi:RND superfamily putative drug exporter
MQGTTQQMNLKYQQDSFASMLKQADEMQGMIENLERACWC